MSFAIGSLAQGTVNWTAVGAAFQGQTNGTAYSSFVTSSGAAAASGTQGLTLGNNTANNTALGYSGYKYALLVGGSSAPTTVAEFSSWSNTGLAATNSGASNGRIVQILAAGGLGTSQSVANNWTAGASANIFLVGWSANLGSDWATALANLTSWSSVENGFTGANAAYFGVSALGTLTSGTGNPGVTVFGVGAGQLNNSALNTPAGTPLQMYQLAVVPTPEPGTMALAALGGASLLLFRRRK